MTAPEHDDRLEPYRRMWVLRLLDMALDESAVGAAIDDDAPVDFGQEAVAVGAVAALRPGDLVNATTPRFRHAQQIGLGLPLGPAIAELLGTTRGGAGGSRKSGAADWKQALANESALGQSTLFALGDANAQRMAGDGRVTLCAIAGSDTHSVEFATAAKIAASWRLPVVFVVQNVRGGPDARRCAYRSETMPMALVDGRDVVAVGDSVGQAVRHASAGDGPSLVEAITYRTNHPVAIDPLVLARRRLMADGVDPDRLVEVERGARHLVAEAMACAKALVRARRSDAVSAPDRWSAAS
ncbi:thiamine pyrophosphate-dependent enzyme [Mycobacterium avium]|uniref:Dehydrogenase E1 component superfamily protein n=1 Tax=Mycobacterium avium (strain 104) TaxID=243243 RepID=A0A0H2ZTG9_MYCA1|nr:thiamine pyrophosphate-dependent enzyme [Mycobacterium avium]ETB07366.1 dehydrogenase [Mycobacterium avium subsp. silvaticum ATCC 49884]ETB19220.1 dehydrogenase [Mycobacterium avium subsp. avium 11-4751]ETB43241.1 dehydrogenase [Mycobacterium avium 11-0986]EUA40312.1 dehydrogenase E1 component family protein [Mycobacterium avium subsp. avium 2285 (R)]TXA41961.1 dehydrogenase [Mycobacterium tuberculosis variant bovis]